MRSKLTAGVPQMTTSTARRCNVRSASSLDVNAIVSSYGLGASELIGGNWDRHRSRIGSLCGLDFWRWGRSRRHLALPRSETILDGATLKWKKRSPYCQE